MDGLLMDGFPEMWVPQNHPKVVIIHEKDNGLGYPYFRNPP